MKKLIIRADDLGYCEAVNYGIEKTVRCGPVRTVGLMTNMEAAEHGVHLLKNYDICMGLHVNICDGYPLSDRRKVHSLLQENGMFKTAGEYRGAAEDIAVYEEAVTEVTAQYERFLELTGRKPSYIDIHSVSSENLEAAVKEVAAQEGTDYLPLRFNEPVCFRGYMLTIHMDSIFPGYDPFESLKTAAAHSNDDIIPLMVCHPGYVDEHLRKTSLIVMQRPAETEMLSSPDTMQWLKDNRISIITPDHLTKTEIY